MEVKFSATTEKQRLYKIRMGKEVEPNSAAEKEKWFNRLSEAYGLFYFSISSDILFNIELALSPNEVKSRPS